MMATAGFPRILWYSRGDGAGLHSNTVATGISLTVGMGTIMQQTAVSELRNCSYYYYQYVYFAAYADTSVYLLDNSQFSCIKLFAKTEVNLSFGLKPDFRSGLSFGLKLYFKTEVLAER